MKQHTAINPHMRFISRPAISVERWAVPALVLITAIPVVVAYYLIGESLRLDETQSLWQTSRSVSGILAVVAGDVHVPLYHVLLHYWRSFLGEGIEVARLFSLLFFVLSIPAIYALGKRSYSVPAGLLAALLLAVSPFMNWYANEIRMYTLFVFIVIVNQYLFVRLFQDEKPRDTIWALYALSAILGVFAHYFFFLNLLAQAVFYFLRRQLFPPQSLHRFGISAVLVLASFAPWVWYVLFRGLIGFQEPLLFPPSAVNLFSAFSEFLFGFQSTALNTIFLSSWPIAVILALVALGRRQRFSPQTEYFGLTVLVSFSVAFVVSYLIAPVFLSRYLAFTLPSFYLLVISLFSMYARRFRVAAQWSLAALMLLALSIQIANPDAPIKERYADAVTYLSNNATAQDIILVSAPFTIYPVQYYYRGAAPLSTLPFWNQYEFGPIPPFNAEELPAQVKNATRNYQNVYLLLSYDQGYEESVQNYFDSHYQRIGEKNFSEGLNAYVYRLRYNTDGSAISIRP